jgi:hypothetical protein
VSLNWDIGKVKDYEAVWPHDQWEQDYESLTKEQQQEGLKTEALIWLTIGIGMGDITEENVDEFTARVMIWEKVRGNYLRLDKEPYYLTRSDIERRIGLWTNASRETKAAWNKNMMRLMWEDADRRVSNAKKDQEKATA